MKSAVTVSLVEEARGGPFVFWDDLELAFKSAAELGFDAIEIFAPGPDQIKPSTILKYCECFGIKVAAVGTGAGMVKHGLTLTDAEVQKRTAALEFISQMIQFGAELDAPAIIGSMQGRWTPQVSRDQALLWLTESLNQLGEIAAQSGQKLFYEPLNRYETNLARTLDEGVQLIQSVASPNVRLLADLFHLNIEESSIEQSIEQAGEYIGHVHFVDSNRRAAGMGHIVYPPIIQALRKTNYQGYLSAEAFALPDSETAAKKTIDTFRKFVAS
ncbi:MAG: sugar phosphate isomerase/epimerase family protein [Pirellulales bacterium]